MYNIETLSTDRVLNKEQFYRKNHAENESSIKYWGIRSLLPHEIFLNMGVLGHFWTWGY